MAHAGGRPTKLDDEIIRLATDYVERTSNAELDELPTIEGLALELWINRDTIYDWESIPELSDNATDEQVEQNAIRQQFSDIVKRLRSTQAQKLMQRSLVNKYNPMISKLLLSKHGYVEKSEVDSKVSGELKTGSHDPALAERFGQFLKGETKK